MRTRRRIGQAEIAHAAGVSVSTVSRVLTGAPGISDEVRGKVMKIAEDLGHPVSVDVPRSRVKAAIAFLATGPDLLVGALYQTILEGIHEAAAPAGLQLSVALRERMGAIPDYLLEDPDVGIFLIGLDPNEGALEQMGRAGRSVVLVNGLDPDLRFDAVAPANFFAGRLAARHLAALGHRRLLHLTTRQRWTLNRRAQGFASGVQDFAPEAQVDIIDLESLDAASVVAAADRLFADDRFQDAAILCGNDIAALTLIQALRSRGLHVPDDVSVMGFDDLPFAALCNPPLTTIRVDWRRLGREAVRLMLARYAEPESGAVQVQLGVSLVPRESVRCFS